MLWLLPLAVAFVLISPVLLAPVSRRADLLLSRVALPTFGFYVANQSPRRTREEELLRAAYVGQTHRVYAARTLLMATLAALSGSVVGVYLAAGVLMSMAVTAAAIRGPLPARLEFLAALTKLQTLSLGELFGLLLLSGATLGTALAVGTYWARWRYLDQRATVRAREINATLPRTVAFIYALSRSGMPFPAVLDTLTRNQEVYGEAAREIGIAVREMNAFGTDVLTSLQRMAARTPSDNLEELGENLASVLGSGRSLSEFLREQYEHYQEAAEAQQEQYLDLLSTFAEVYVTVFVAGPLFFITVLVIVGLVIQSTITLTRVIGYLGIPLASAAFILYIDSMTQTLRAPEGQEPEEHISLTMPAASMNADEAELASKTSRTDGGHPDSRWYRNLERLAAYDRFEPFREWIDDPLGSIMRYPLATFAVTVPLGAGWVSMRVGTFPLAPIDLLRAIDSPVIEATLFALGTFAVLYEFRKRRIRALETAVPDLLDRMASVNEAGMTIVESIRRMTRSDLGALTPEISRTWQDIRWGADARTALRRLDKRTKSIAVTRAVTLITNAMRASGDIAPVLRIAADEAYEIRRLRRERRQEMLTYQMVIYIAFLVFIGIIVALTVSFIPAVEQAGTTGTGSQISRRVSTGLFTGIGDVNTNAYQLVFYHIAMIQAVCSGLIAGQLGEGGVYDGAKHATILLALAYVTFLFI